MNFQNTESGETVRCVELPDIGDRHDTLRRGVKLSIMNPQVFPEIRLLDFFSSGIPSLFRQHHVFDTKVRVLKKDKEIVIKRLETHKQTLQLRVISLWARKGTHERE